MEPMIEMVLFDAGGTLLGTNTDHAHWYEQFFVEACADQGVAVTPADVDDALAEAAAHVRPGDRCSSDAQVREFWEHMYAWCFRRLVPGCDADALARHYIDRFERGEFVRLFPDALEALDAVRRAGVRAGVVSNFGTYLGHFLEITGIGHFFEFVVVSAAEGCEKPHPAIFELALERAGLPAERILFVGDHPREDYAAAERHGMFAVLVDRHDRHADKPRMRRVRRLSDIGAFLNGAAPAGQSSTT